MLMQRSYFSDFQVPRALLNAGLQVSFIRESVALADPVGGARVSITPGMLTGTRA